jgi:hypothetical protein
MNLSQFTGTENWYKHALTKNVYTDGVKYFAEHAGAYWFIDKVLYEYAVMGEEFLSITLIALGGQAKIRVTDGNDRTLADDFISFTDCPNGTYEFFFTDGVLLLTSEY